jgi:hypothetical protein
VEQAASASETMRDQAVQLAKVVSSFKLESEQGSILTITS